MPWIWCVEWCVGVCWTGIPQYKVLWHPENLPWGIHDCAVVMSSYCALWYFLRLGMVWLLYIQWLLDFMFRVVCCHIYIEELGELLFVCWERVMCDVWHVIGGTKIAIVASWWRIAENRFLVETFTLNFVLGQLGRKDDVPGQFQTHVWCRPVLQGSTWSSCAVLGGWPVWTVWYCHQDPAWSLWFWLSWLWYHA